MYHAIVKRKLIKSFEALNAGRVEVITRQFRKTGVSHWFSGEGHPLAGLRTRIEDIYLWYERLRVLMPDLAFQIEKVAVSGFPWRTVAMLEWTDSLSDRAGTRYRNRGVHVITISWGKVIALEVFCDTDYLNGYFEALKAQGVPEASLPPIESLKTMP
ncbi:MAG: nuclear transport factor 2 family protein [Clostridiales bacterium]|nr:nuclear transport factor 2 family protein [Clostridiales bacterium]